MITHPNSAPAPDEYDVVIVGSGAGSVVAALAAMEGGLRPLIVEKQPVVGGTTAYSGGMAWLPANPLMAREGVKDSCDEARTYLDAAIRYEGPAVSDARKDAFLKSIPEMVAFLESKGMQFQRPRFWPDYHSDLPGACQTSRSVGAALFDLNELGDWKRYFAATGHAPLRMHVEEATHLALVKRSWPARWLALRVAWRLLTARMTGRDIRGAGAALQGRLLQIALRDNIPIWRETPVTGLMQEGGRVVGVEVTVRGEPRRIGAKAGVLINAGGYSHNRRFREKYARQPLYDQFSGASPGDTGDLIQQAMALGAATDCLDESLWGVASMAANGEFPGGRLPVAEGGLPVGHHFDISLPHCILVDQNGQRFTDEAGSYMTLGQDLYRRHEETGKGIPCWAIIESRHRKRYPWGMTLGRTPRAWLGSGYMKQADSLVDLAVQCGIEPQGLHTSVDRFNGFCRTGRDEDYHRGGKAFDHCHGDPTVAPNPNLGAIERPPFYAVAVYPGDVSTWGGLVADEHARVLNRSGEVMPGLYVTGTSAASVFGRTYTGAGASIGPAMVFGYIAARHMAHKRNDIAGEQRILPVAAK